MTMAPLASLVPRPLVLATRPVRQSLVKAPYRLLFVHRRLAGHRGTLLLEPYGIPKATMHFFALFKICAALGWHIRDGRETIGGLRLFWPNKETPEEQSYPELINGRCININKTVVTKHFESIFGYGYAIDPREPSGPYVRKSDENAKHDGQILEGSREPEPGFVYQRFINIVVDENTGEDIRLIFMRGLLPFCYRKRRPLQIWFQQQSTFARIEETSALITHAEASRVSALCDAMGLEYGEVDCLRDRDDRRLYVMDVSRTPTGPPKALPWSQKMMAVEMMAAAFAKAFPMTSGHDWR